LITHLLNSASLKKAKLVLSGTVTKNGVPIQAAVCAYDRNTGELKSKSKSKPNGKYILLGTNVNSNFVVAIDPANEYNLATQDNVK